MRMVGEGGRVCGDHSGKGVGSCSRLLLCLEMG